MRFAVLIGVLITLVAFSFPVQIMGIFTDDPSVIEMGAPYVRVVCLSYLFFCISQVMIASMRAVETAKIGLYVSFVALAVNVSLNYVLIFGKLGFPALGVTGAAIATLISRIVESAVMVVYVRFVDRKLNLRFRDLLRSDRRLTRDFIRYGMPIVGGQIVWSVNMMGQTMILGRFDAGVIAATSIAGMLHNMMYIAMNGFSSAVGIITGKTVGAGAHRQDPRVFAHDAGHFPRHRPALRHRGVSAARPVYQPVQRKPGGDRVFAPVYQRDLDHDHRHLLSGGVPVRPCEIRRRHRVRL